MHSATFTVVWDIIIGIHQVCCTELRYLHRTAIVDYRRQQQVRIHIFIMMKSLRNLRFYLGAQFEFFIIWFYFLLIVLKFNYCEIDITRNNWQNNDSQLQVPIILLSLFCLHTLRLHSLQFSVLRLGKKKCWSILL